MRPSEATHRTKPPGPFASLTGTSNAEGTTWHAMLHIHGAEGGPHIDAGHYAEVLVPEVDGVRVRALHGSGWFAGTAAITERFLGSGRVIHAGVALNDAVLEWLWSELRFPKPQVAVVAHDVGAEVLTREGEGYLIHVAINHGTGPSVYYLYHQCTDLISGATVTNSFTLQANEWRILREDRTDD